MEATYSSETSVDGLHCIISQKIDFSSLYRFQTVSKAHTVCARVFESRVNLPGHEDDSSLSSTEVKNAWSHTSIPPYIFVSRCSVIQNDCFNFCSSFVMCLYYVAISSIDDVSAVSAASIFRAEVSRMSLHGYMCLSLTQMSFLQSKVLRYLIILKFELMAVTMKITAFWKVTPCSLVDLHRRYGAMYRLHL
jgi:hypothetical protein